VDGLIVRVHNQLVNLKSNIIKTKDLGNLGSIQKKLAKTSKTIVKRSKNPRKVHLEVLLVLA